MKPFNWTRFKVLMLPLKMSFIGLLLSLSFLSKTDTTHSFFNIIKSKLDENLVKKLFCQLKC